MKIEYTDDLTQEELDELQDKIVITEAPTLVFKDESDFDLLFEF